MATTVRRSKEPARKYQLFKSLSQDKDAKKEVIRMFDNEDDVYYYQDLDVSVSITVPKTGTTLAIRSSKRHSNEVLDKKLIRNIRKDLDILRGHEVYLNRDSQVVAVRIAEDFDETISDDKLHDAIEDTAYVHKLLRGAKLDYVLPKLLPLKANSDVENFSRMKEWVGGRGIRVNNKIYNIWSHDAYTYLATKFHTMWLDNLASLPINKWKRDKGERLFWLYTIISAPDIFEFCERADENLPTMRGEIQIIKEVREAS